MFMLQDWINNISQNISCYKKLKDFEPDKKLLPRNSWLLTVYFDNINYQHEDVNTEESNIWCIRIFNLLSKCSQSELCILFNYLTPSYN